MVTTGRQLVVERVAAGVRQSRLAKEMGVSRQTLWSIEQRALVPEDRARQYREAIARICDLERKARVA